MGSWGCTLSCADGNWDTQRTLMAGDTVTSDEGTVSPNLQTIAWLNDFRIVFILNNNLKWFGCSKQPAP